MGNGSITKFKIGLTKFTVHGSHRYGPQMYSDQVGYLARGFIRAGIKVK
jgi:hypothetical protein